ncbi:acyl carrier protein [Desulfatitalea alkaliphila]|uniref:Acyl carrier protein n=1 Tax=Desulfatitalea alkaliphila TaxID=2929485 RepID=A0AA41UMJ3_9BACT|nr:acyl carrier protein [Desulfatitalea alkaliphila]MCJ8502666.1 acyl carrier protein [Desulfatitalea alkaliphila]
MATREQISKTILDIIRTIAPEADLANIDPADRFRNQFDFDSVDFMNLAAALQTTLQVNIPEEDYPHLATLKGCIAYLTSKVNT